ncbi:Uncharacterised protein [[Ruminococcus] torques]|nr:Uncharacterised protein [[Ruminococcus] torques]
MHICIIISFLHGFFSLQYIFRTAGSRIDWAHCDHAANLKFRINLMSSFYRFGTGNQFIVRCLIHQFFRIFFRFNYNPGISIKHKSITDICLVVNLIKCHPIFYFVFVSLKACYCKFHEEINQFSVSPSTVLLYKMQRHLKMTQCDHWFDPIFQTFIKHVIIEF